MFRYIDRGRNPQLYTKDCIEKALHKNEQVKGKIDSLKKFKANVLADLGQTFPNELNKYRALRSNCYGAGGVSGPPPPPTLNILGTPNPQQQQQQNLLSGPGLSIQQQQLNNVSLAPSSCLNNSQQQSNVQNMSSLLGCDGISTTSASSNSNNIGGPPGSQ